MANFADSLPIVLKNVRLDYFDVFTAAEPQEEKDKANPKKWKFKVKAIIDPASDAANLAKAAMISAAKELWGDNHLNVIRALPANSKALRKGEDNLGTDGSIRAGYEGMLYISASNVMKPQVIGPLKHNGKFVNVTADARAFIEGVEISPPPYPIVAPYRGCYVNLKVQFVAGKADPQRGMPNQVYCKLLAMQFVRDGEAFGNGPTTAEGFDDVEGYVAPSEESADMF